MKARGLRRPGRLLTSTTTKLQFGQVEVPPLEDADRIVDRALARGGLARRSGAALRAIAHHEALYRIRGNPYDALEAFVIARSARLPVPAFALRYLERSVKRVLLMARVPRTRSARAVAIAAAFGLAPSRMGKGRRADAKERLDRDHQAARMVEAVLRMRRSGISRENAIAEVATEFNSSASVVRRALRRHGL